MNTGRIETIGLTLIAASVILFSATAFVRETTRPADRPGLDAATARTLDIAIRARSAGRHEQADALLAALAAPPPSATVPRHGVGLTAVTDFHPGGLEVSESWYGAALALGVAGLVSAAVATRRRRNLLRLLASELDRPHSADDANALVGAVFRMRAEHAGAEYQLRTARDAVAKVPLRAFPAASPSFGMPEPTGRSDTPGVVPEAESEFGRIVEISAIESDCGT